MTTPVLLRTVAAGSLAVVAATFALPRPAVADDASTALIAGAAAAIVGGLLYDSNHRPYYDRDGRRVYVSDRVAQEYHRRGGYDRGSYNDHGSYHDHGGDHHH